MVEERNLGLLKATGESKIEHQSKETGEKEGGGGEIPHTLSAIFYTSWI